MENTTTYGEMFHAFVATTKPPAPAGPVDATLPQHMQDAYAYPEHCGQKTSLSVFGWRCEVCHEYLAFKREQHA